MSDSTPVSQVKGNFNRIARDLDRAIRIAQFTMTQRYLLDEARELSWAFSYQQPVSFRFNFSEMQRISRVDRKGLGRQRNALVRQNVLIDVGDGSLLINKDYRTWLNLSGAPLFSEAQIRWCLSVRSKGRGGDRSAQYPWGAQCPGPHKLYPPPGEPSAQVVTDYTHPPGDGDAQVVTDYTQAEVAPPRPPVEERAPEFQKRLNTESQKSREECATPPQEEGEKVPPYPPDDGFLMIMTGPHEIEHARALEIWRLLWLAFKNQRVNNEWYCHQRWFSADHWEAAIRDVGTRGVRVTSIKLIELSAGDYESGKARPPATPPAPAAPRPSRYEQDCEKAKILQARLFGPKPTEGGGA